MSFTNDLCFIVLRTLLITTGTLGMMMSTTVFKYSKKRTLSIFSIYLLWVAASSWIIVRFWGFQMLLSLFLLTISVVLVYKCGQEKLNNLYYQVKNKGDVQHGEKPEILHSGIQAADRRSV